MDQKCKTYYALRECIAGYKEAITSINETKGFIDTQLEFLILKLNCAEETLVNSFLGENDDEQII